MPHFGELNDPRSSSTDSAGADLTLAQRIFAARQAGSNGVQAAASIVVNDLSLTLAQRSLAQRQPAAAVAAVVATAQVDVLATQIFGA